MLRLIICDAVQETEKFMLKNISGNLLDSDCQYIAHQCNCHSRSGAGLASAIFKAFPWADIYSDRSERGDDAPLFGSITVHGDPKRNQRHVINIYIQLKPGKPSPGRDVAASRIQAFSKALDQIAELPELESIGFAFIRCVVSPEQPILKLHLRPFSRPTQHGEPLAEGQIYPHEFTGFRASPPYDSTSRSSPSTSTSRERTGR